MSVRKKRMVGLSIGSRMMAVAQNRMTASSVMITEHLSVSEVPDGAIDNYGINDIAAVSQAIRDLLNASNIRAREVTLAISGSSLITRILTLPSMLEDEMLDVLRGEVENYPVLAGDEAVLDFQIVNTKSVGTAQQLEVLVVAASKELVDSYKAVMEAADLKLLAIEIVPISTLRTFTSGQSDNQMNAPAMLVNVEESEGTIAVIQDEVIQFIHRIETGTDMLSGDENALEGLTGELKSALDYYQTSSSESSDREDLKEIILFMDGVDSDYICRELGERLVIPISSPLSLETADENAKTQAIEHSLSAYAAVGAAIRTSKSDGIINLLRPQRIEKSSLRNKLAIFCLCFSSIILLSICANFFLNAKAEAIIQNIVSTQQTHGGLDTQEWIEMSVIKANTSELESQAKIVKAAIGSTRRVRWSRIIQEISMIIPTTMWLTELSWEEEDDITFNGVAMSHDSVLRFRDTLTDSSFFDSVRLVFARNNKIGGIQLVKFQMVCRIEQIL